MRVTHSCGLDGIVDCLFPCFSDSSKQYDLTYIMVSVLWVDFRSKVSLPRSKIVSGYCNPYETTFLLVIVVLQVNIEGRSPVTTSISVDSVSTRVIVGTPTKGVVIFGPLSHISGLRSSDVNVINVRSGTLVDSSEKGVSQYLYQLSRIVEVPVFSTYRFFIRRIVDTGFFLYYLLVSLLPLTRLFFITLERSKSPDSVKSLDLG